MRGGLSLSRSNIALYEPPKPMNVSDFRDSSENLNQEDVGIFCQAILAQIDKDFINARILYVELLKKSYLKSNSVILHNLDMCNRGLL